MVAIRTKEGTSLALREPTCEKEDQPTMEGGGGGRLGIFICVSSLGTIGLGGGGKFV